MLPLATALGEEHTLRGEAVIELSLALRAQHRVDEAKKIESQDLAAIFRKEESAADIELLAAQYLDRGKIAEAEQSGRIALDVKRQSMSQHPPISLAATLALLGRVLIAEGKLEEAEQLLRESLAIRREALPGGHWLVGETESLLGDCLAKRRK